MQNALGYFFLRLFFALGVNGSGGLFSIRRTNSSVRRFAISGGSRSSSSISRFGFVAVMMFSRYLSSVNALSFLQDKHIYTACLTPSSPNVGSGRLPVLFSMALPQ